VESRKLEGHSILIVEDELMIIMDMQATFEEAGARVFATTTLTSALVLADTPGLSAAVIDFALGTDDGGAVCRHLTKLSVPFVFHSGIDRATVSCWNEAPFISKPAHPQAVIDAVLSVINNRRTAQTRTG
jgi:DNA-binding response OmpR family regulator